MMSVHLSNLRINFLRGVVCLFAAIFSSQSLASYSNYLGRIVGGSLHNFMAGVCDSSQPTAGSGGFLAEQAVNGVESFDRFMSAPRGKAARTLVEESLANESKKLTSALVERTTEIVDPLAGIIMAHLWRGVRITSLGVALASSILVMKTLLQKKIHSSPSCDLSTHLEKAQFIASVKKAFGMLPRIYQGPRYSDLLTRKNGKSELDLYFLALQKSAKVNREMPSLLIHGFSDVDKIDISRRIAKELNFNFLVLSGSSLFQFDEATTILKMSEIFKWSRQRKFHRTLIFIDDAHLFLHKQAVDGPSKLFVHFLSLTEKMSKNYTIVYASNMPEKLDLSIDSRISYQFKLPVSSFGSELQLVKAYFFEVIRGDREIQVNFKANARFFEGIVKSLQDFSKAGLEKFWHRCKYRALMRGNGLEASDVKAELKRAQSHNEFRSSANEPLSVNEGLLD